MFDPCMANSSLTKNCFISWTSWFIWFIQFLSFFHLTDEILCLIVLILLCHFASVHWMTNVKLIYQIVRKLIIVSQGPKERKWPEAGSHEKAWGFIVLLIGAQALFSAGEACIPVNVSPRARRPGSQSSDMQIINWFYKAFCIFINANNPFNFHIEQYKPF